MSHQEEKSKRKKFVYVSIFMNLLILLTFKYFNFFSDATQQLLNLAGIDYLTPHISVLLPMGISFYTLQTMGYSIDVYKGVIKAEKHPGIFALYVTFFPQLVAGPIERAKTLLPQFRVEQKFSTERALSGLRLILFGLYKKVAVADQIAPIVDSVFANSNNYNGISILVVNILFALQIYFDFAGYSDIAIGSARVLGFNLMTNFKRPFFARSLGELWARWHLSLTTWFRDYIFVPMIRNKFDWRIAIFTIYVLSGMWHGANYNFFIWGSFNAFVIILSRSMPKTKEWIWKALHLNRFPKLDKVVDQVYTLLLFSVPTVFFRSATFEQAIEMFQSLLVYFPSSIASISSSTFRHILLLDQDSITWAIALLGIVVLFFIEVAEENKKGWIQDLIMKWSMAPRWALYFFMMFSVILLSGAREVPFTYFQF